MVKLFAALMLIVSLIGCGPKLDESTIALTAEEMAWIKTHANVTWAVEDNRPPYIFVENGISKGLSRDYMDLIGKKTGIKFVQMKVNTFINGYDLTAGGIVDVVTAIHPTPERSTKIGFTAPISYVGGVFLFRSSTIPRQPLAVGISRGFAVKDYLNFRFPDMKVVEVQDDTESLLLLQKGLLDASVMDEASADHLLEHLAIKDSVRKARINFDYPYSLGYKKENQILGSILTKAVNSINQHDKEKINSRWIK